MKSETLRPANQISPEVGSISLRMQRPVVDLPQPEFSDQTQRFAGGDFEADVIDCVHLVDLAAKHAALHGEVLHQLVHAQQWLGHCTIPRVSSNNLGLWPTDVASIDGMAGLVPTIHDVLVTPREVVGGRAKPGHDSWCHDSWCGGRPK